MKVFIATRLKKIIPKKVQNLFTWKIKRELELLKQQTQCYSQEGEDLILLTFLEEYKTGFYIDIGSYDPVKYSNTYLYYLKGWTGINIDARPGSMTVFNTLRPNDINLEVAIGIEEKMLTYYMFDEPGLNGFSKLISEDRHQNTPYKIQKTIQLPIERLESILDKNVPPETIIHFMDIDVEGLDLDVLKSNNWEKYKPIMLLVETSLLSDDALGLTSPIHNFLIEKGYTLVAKTYRTSFYKLL